MYSNLCKGLFAVALMGAAQSAFANVITDWNEKAVTIAAPMASLSGTVPYMGQRIKCLIVVGLRAC
jgi:hypothetical protein